MDSTIWDELWALLPGWAHYGIDLPGHGKSPPLRQGTTLLDVGRQCADIAFRLGVQHVVGLSFGSIIALQVAMSLPRAFETLTLAAPALAGGPVDQNVGLRYMQLLDLYKRRGPGPWMTELWMRIPPGTFAYATGELRARLATVINRHTWSELDQPEVGFCALARQTQDIHVLRLSTARLLLMVGEYEFPAFQETAAILLRIRPDARFVELPGAGHLCLLHDQEAAARILAEHWS